MMEEQAFGWGRSRARERERRYFSAYRTHDVDQLDEGEAELDVDCVRHVLHWPDELVVAPEEIAHQPLLILGAQACKHTRKHIREYIYIYTCRQWGWRLTDAEYRRDEEEPDEPRRLEQHPDLCSALSAGCVSLRPLEMSASAREASSSSSSHP